MIPAAIVGVAPCSTGQGQVNQNTVHSFTEMTMLSFDTFKSRISSGTLSWLATDSVLVSLHPSLNNDITLFIKKTSARLARGCRGIYSE